MKTKKERKCKKYIPFDACGWLGKDDAFCLNCMKSHNQNKSFIERKMEEFERKFFGYSSKGYRTNTTGIAVHYWSLDDKETAIDDFFKKALTQQKKEILKTLHFTKIKKGITVGDLNWIIKETLKNL